MFPADRLAVIPPGMAPYPHPFGRGRRRQGSRDRYRRTARGSVGNDDLPGGRSSCHGRGPRRRVCDRQSRGASRSYSATEPSAFGSPNGSRWPTIPASAPGFGAVLDIYCQPAVVASAGRTFIQAFGHAIPCIATDVKGLSGLIDPGENGVIVPRSDPGALARAIIALLEDPSRGSPAWLRRTRSGSRPFRSRTRGRSARRPLSSGCLRRSGLIAPYRPTSPAMLAALA